MTNIFDLQKMEQHGIAADRRSGAQDQRERSIHWALELNRNQGPTSAAALIKDAMRLLHFVICGRDELRPYTED